MKIKIREIEIQINILIIAVPPLLFFIGCLKEYAIAFFSITLHEIGHMAAAYFYGYKPSCVRLTPVGFSLSINSRDCSRVNSIKIYSAGPAVNLLLFGAASSADLIFPALHGHLNLLSATNLYLALFNLIPAFPLDGGRILLEVLAGSMGLLAADRMIRRLALILSIAMLLIGMYQLYISAFNFTLIIIGLYIIFLLNTGRMESALMNIRQIIYRRSRLIKKGIYPARDLVVVKSTQLSETLNCMDFDRFHFVHVLDDDLRLLRVFTENEIMDAIVKGGDNMTFELLLASYANQPSKENIEKFNNKDEH